MKLLAQAGEIVGSIESPLAGTGYGSIQTGAVGMFITNVIRLAFVGAGIYALFNFIIAGYSYMNASGDSKKLTEAWSRIWQSLLGLIIIVGSFAIASLFGYLIFDNPGFILNPTIYGPNE